MDWKDSLSVVLPIVYDMNTNITQLAERREPAQSVAISAASMRLRTFAESYMAQNDCSLFMAVRDLLMNLVLPTDPPQSQMQGQINSPNPMMQQMPPMVVPNQGYGMGQPGPNQ